VRHSKNFKIIGLVRVLPECETAVIDDQSESTHAEATFDRRFVYIQLLTRGSFSHKTEASLLTRRTCLPYDSLAFL